MFAKTHFLVTHENCPVVFISLPPINHGSVEKNMPLLPSLFIKLVQPRKPIFHHAMPCHDKTEGIQYLFVKSLVTPPKTNMVRSPENGPLEKEIPIGFTIISRFHVNFRGCTCHLFISIWAPRPPPQQLQPFSPCCCRSSWQITVIRRSTWHNIDTKEDLDSN